MPPKHKFWLVAIQMDEKKILPPQTFGAQPHAPVNQRFLEVSGVKGEGEYPSDASN